MEYTKSHQYIIAKNSLFQVLKHLWEASYSRHQSQTQVETSMIHVTTAGPEHE